MVYATLIICLIIGVPIAFSIVAALMYFMAVGEFPYHLRIVATQMFSGIQSYPLLAIPLFILAGELMNESGITSRIIAFTNVFVGRLRAGLAMVNILASMFFGGISGSSVADVSSIGSILIPMMKKEGYDDEFSVNITITSATQGIVIPPSHNAVIYSYAAGGAVSIAQLFLAGFIPGVMIGLSLMVLSFIMATRHHYPKGNLVPLREAIKISGQAFMGLITVIIIVGGVIGGIFTATESASVAVIYAFLVTLFVYRDFKLRQLPQLFHGVIKTVCIVMILIGFASGFAYLMALMQVPAKATHFFLSISNNKYVILALVNIMLLILGTIMDMAPLLLICTPILLPVVTSFGIDPVHFGIIMMLNLSIGLVTPPVGSTLFVGCAIGDVSIERVSRKLWPFWLSMFVILMLVTYFPFFSMWIPMMAR
jgi:tripartite ATP-independent transporter DctM subunit